jgi:hypothetical protein
VYPYGAFDIKNPNNGNVYHLKAYFDNFPSENESIGLNDPVYKDRLFCFSHIVFVFSFFTFVLLVSFQPRSNGG